MPWFIFTQKVLDDFLVVFVLETILVDELSQSVVILFTNYSESKYTAIAT